MIISSGKVISFHGVIGYLSLAAMVTDTVFSWLNVNRYGLNADLSKTIYKMVAGSVCLLGAGLHHRGGHRDVQAGVTVTTFTPFRGGIVR